MDISEIKSWTKTVSKRGGSKWFHCSGFDVYFRYIAKIVASGKVEKCLVIASVEKQAGINTPVEVFLAAVEEFALELGSPVYVENIVNERFYDKLLGLGYGVPDKAVPIHCLIKWVNK